MNKTKYYVTGASGWLGRNLVKTILDQTPTAEIHCLLLPKEDNRSLLALAPSAKIFQGDIRYPESCLEFFNKAENATLLHTAGIIHPKTSEFYDINLKGTDNLLKAASIQKIKRAVIVSSNSPLGCNPHEDHLFDEESFYNPYLNYGRSKMLMEETVRNYQASGKIETVIIRPPWFYGPNQPPRQSLFFSMIRNGKMPQIGSGNNRRSMVYIDNLCQGILLGATVQKARGQTYWIADKEPYLMKDIVGTVQKLLENEFSFSTKPTKLKLPSVVSEIAYVLDLLTQKLGFYLQKIHVLSELNKNIACSIEKAERELGYKPKIALEEGMRRSIQWCLDEKISI